MRVLFRRIRRGRRSGQGSGAAYRSAAYTPLRPAQVRERRFRPTPVGRRGLDPAEVREFLDRVAGDLASAYDQAARSRQETERIKDALRRWQSRQARLANEGRHW